jgi:hypothetical protein
MAKPQNPLRSSLEFVWLDICSEETFPFDIWIISTYNHTYKEP